MRTDVASQGQMRSMAGYANVPCHITLRPTSAPQLNHFPTMSASSSSSSGTSRNNGCDHDQVRCAQWFALAAFTTIALVAMTSRFNGNISDATKEQCEIPWATTAMGVALITSTVSLASHFVVKDRFVGSLAEGGLVRRSCCVCIWVANYLTIAYPHSLLLQLECGQPSSLLSWIPTMI
jgi:hypothetical protein